MQVLPKTNETPLRLWTVEEYHRMAEVGILQPDEHVELVAGQILRKMSPQKTPHASAITRTSRILRNSLGEKVLLRTQLPVTLNDFSEPEPDVVIVKLDPMDYIDHHPLVSEIYLVIEIADSTLKRDCEVKALDYASSGIKDYWVLDINQRQLHVFRDGTSEGYQNKVILGENEQVSSLKFPDLSIKVSEMLPPVISK